MKNKMKKYLLITLITFSFIPIVLLAEEGKEVKYKEEQKLPSFKVVGRDQPSALSILVPPDTTKEQLKSLIYEFRKARKEDYFSKMIPPTTPKGEFGNYAIVVIYVFTEPEWASEDKLKKSTKVNPNDSFYKEYSEHIKAYYYGGTFTKDNQIEGSIGYAEGERIYTSIYEKLF